MNGPQQPSNSIPLWSQGGRQPNWIQGGPQQPQQHLRYQQQSQVQLGYQWGPMGRACMGVYI